MALVHQRRALPPLPRGKAAGLQGVAQELDNHPGATPRRTRPDEGFEDVFQGYEEPEVPELLEYCRPYLPHSGAMGEMVLSTGGAIYLHGKGADGVVDISPFSCMNGIVTEAVYPRVSREHDDMPIRVFYFDGTQSDLDRDVGIFLELAQTYKRRKKVQRARA